MKIVGVGNAWRHDDAAGLHVIDRLAKVYTPATLETSDGEISRLLDILGTHEHVIIVDAADAPAAAGTILEVDGLRGPLTDVRLRSSSHALGLAEAVELSRALGAMPRRLELYGIVGADFSRGVGLSPAVGAAVAQLADTLRDRAGGKEGPGKVGKEGQ